MKVSTWSMADVRARHRGHWFDAETMRFFRCRVGSYGYTGDGGATVYFVSSEQFVWLGHVAPRRYSVRVCDADGDIDTAGEFQAYASRGAADRAARKLAAQQGAAEVAQ